MTLGVWLAFIAFVIVMLWADLVLVNQRGSLRRAIVWTGVCVGSAIAFTALVYQMYDERWLGVGKDIGQPLQPADAAMLYLTSWGVGYTLSFETVFAIAMIFRFYAVPAASQARVLFWGILIALVLRGGMIAGGTALVREVLWAGPVFGVILLLATFRMFITGDELPNPERGWVAKLIRRHIHVSPEFHGGRFIAVSEGRIVGTPLLLALAVIAAADIAVAVYSIPAVLGVTTDPFLIFTAGAFSLMGLRSMYSSLAVVIDKFRYLKTSLVFILGFISAKLLLRHWFHFTPTTTMIVVASIICVGLIPSAFASADERRMRRAPVDDLAAAAEAAWRRGRRMVILVVGLTLIFIIAPLTGVIPGPGGIPIAVAGLALLATEFVWARKLLGSLKSRAEAIAESAQHVVGDRPRPWLITPIWLTFGVGIGYLMWSYPHLRLWIGLGAAGPALAIGYWTLGTIKRNSELKKAAAAQKETRSAEG